MFLQTSKILVLPNFIQLIVQRACSTGNYKQKCFVSSASWMAPSFAGSSSESGRERNFCQCFSELHVVATFFNLRVQETSEQISLRSLGQGQQHWTASLSPQELQLKISEWWRGLDSRGSRPDKWSVYSPNHCAAVHPPNLILISRDCRRPSGLSLPGDGLKPLHAR